MDKVQVDIWNFGFLTSGEQDALESLVSQNPAYAQMLEDAKKLYAIARGARLMEGDASGQEALAYYVAQFSLPAGMAPILTADHLQDLKEKIEADTQVYERYVAIKERMEMLISQTDPKRQFEALTGHKLEDMPQHVTKRRSERKRIYGRDERPPEVRERRAVLSSMQRTLYSVATIGLVVFLMLHVNRFERHAYLDPATFYEGSVSGIRGDSIVTAFVQGQDSIGGQRLHADLHVRFAAGLRHLFDAQRIRLGVYYYYDPVKLGAAENAFLEILADENINPSLLDEVKYVLARVYIAKHDIAAAKVLLQEVEETDSVWTTEASTLRAAL